MKKFTAAAGCAALLISLAGCARDKEKPRVYDRNIQRRCFHI